MLRYLDDPNGKPEPDQENQVTNDEPESEEDLSQSVTISADADQEIQPTDDAVDDEAELVSAVGDLQKKTAKLLFYSSASRRWSIALAFWSALLKLASCSIQHLVSSRYSRLLCNLPPNSPPPKPVQLC